MLGWLEKLNSLDSEGKLVIRFLEGQTIGEALGKANVFLLFKPEEVGLCYNWRFNLIYHSTTNKEKHSEGPYIATAIHHFSYLLRLVHCNSTSHPS